MTGRLLLSLVAVKLESPQVSLFPLEDFTPLLCCVLRVTLSLLLLTEWVCGQKVHTHFPVWWSGWGSGHASCWIGWAPVEHASTGVRGSRLYQLFFKHGLLLRWSKLQLLQGALKLWPPVKHCPLQLRWRNTTTCSTPSRLGSVSAYAVVLQKAANLACCHE